MRHERRLPCGRPGCLVVLLLLPCGPASRDERSSVLLEVGAGGELAVQTTKRPGLIKRLKNWVTKWRQPLGNGRSSLTHPPNDIVRKFARRKSKDSYDCRVLLNQDAVFRAIAGDYVVTLPYPASSDPKLERIAHKNGELGFDAQAVVNEGALLECVQGECPDPRDFPFPPLTVHKHEANSGLQTKVALSARVVVNQYAIYELIRFRIGASLYEPLELPHGASAETKERALRLGKGIFDAQQIVNQQDIFRMLQNWDGVSHDEGQAGQL